MDEEEEEDSSSVGNHMRSKSDVQQLEDGNAADAKITRINEKISESPIRASFSFRWRLHLINERFEVFDWTLQSQSNVHESSNVSWNYNLQLTRNTDPSAR